MEKANTHAVTVILIFMFFDATSDFIVDKQYNQRADASTTTSISPRGEAILAKATPCCYRNDVSFCYVQGQIVEHLRETNLNHSKAKKQTKPASLPHITSD